jgi:hypothetical protein
LCALSGAENGADARALIVVRFQASNSYEGERSDPVRLQLGVKKALIAGKRTQISSRSASNEPDAYPADRKTFPLDKWNLAFQRLRRHDLIATISVMTTHSHNTVLVVDYLGDHRGKNLATSPALA